MGFLLYFWIVFFFFCFVFVLFFILKLSDGDNKQLSKKIVVYVITKEITSPSCGVSRVHKVACIHMTYCVRTKYRP